MNQIALDFSAPRAAHVQAALDHAGPQWADVAYKFLCRYARIHATLTGEEVTKAAREWGLSEPPTTRAWGGLYRRAQNEGVIQYLDSEARRYNGSPAPRYRSLTFGGAG